MPTKIDDKTTVETTQSRVLELETQRREVLGALEAAARAGDAQRMIAMRHRLPEVDDQLKDAKALWLGARRREAQRQLDELDKQISAKREDLAKAETKVRESQLHVARANPGLNEGFLTGRTGVLMASAGGPGVVEYGERQRRAAALAGELHTLQVQRSNVAQDLGRVDRELAAWLTER